MLGSTSHLAKAISQDLKDLFPKQRKTQRGKLALLVAAMLHARTANTMDLAAHLPLETERQDMRFQWIHRFLATPLVNCREIMSKIAQPLLRQLVENGKTIVLIIDQTEVLSRRANFSDRSTLWGKSSSIALESQTNKRQ
jgi:hypothetical protein